jgi:hypothetical protein
MLTTGCTMDGVGGASDDTEIVAKLNWDRCITKSEDTAKQRNIRTTTKQPRIDGFPPVYSIETNRSMDGWIEEMEACMQRYGWMYEWWASCRLLTSASSLNSVKYGSLFASAVSSDQYRNVFWRGNELAGRFLIKINQNLNLQYCHAWAVNKGISVNSFRPLGKAIDDMFIIFITSVDDVKVPSIPSQISLLVTTGNSGQTTRRSVIWYELAACIVCMMIPTVRPTETSVTIVNWFVIYGA